MKKIEQITKNNQIVLDYDKSFNRKQIFNILNKYFDKIDYATDGFDVIYNKKLYTILIKNITYLGHPWLAFKKRIQIPTQWNKLLIKPNVFIFGIYNYKDNIIFAIFDKKYRGKNSSAHISSIDILKATEYGIFQKIDKNNNNIIVFRCDKFKEVFSNLIKNNTVENIEEIKLFEIFSSTLNLKWDGIDAYSEMINANFSHKFQGEWPGWYLEFKFNAFLEKNKKYKTICKYVQHKKQNEYDFDLDFVKSKYLGDLKTHSIDSNAILGNDKMKFCEVLERDGKLWYIVFNLKYRKDIDFGCMVSRFWNMKQNELLNKKKFIDSYCKRMKKDGKLLSMHILEFNQFNKKYISNFDQGHQPNGEKRNPKIKINNGNIDNFIIFRKDLSRDS